jgi:hypothetical protein
VAEDMRINVTHAHDLVPDADRRVTVAFQKGEVTTKRKWGEEMIRLGFAEEAKVPTTDEAKKADAARG